MARKVTDAQDKQGPSDPAGVTPVRKGWVESVTPATPYSGAPGGVKVGTVTSNNGSGLVVGVYAEAVPGGVNFWVQVESGRGDLRGFFLDVGSPGGPITRAGSGDNNMNGTGYSFDYGVEIGSSGGSKDYSTTATFTLYDLDGASLASLLDRAVFGIRATSVGTNNTSVKLVGTAPDDMDGDPTDGVDPIAYTPLTRGAPGVASNFRFSYLEAGQYTAAFTCNFGVDIDPTRNEFNPLETPPVGTPPTMRFVRRNFDVSAGSQTLLNFP